MPTCFRALVFSRAIRTGGCAGHESAHAAAFFRAMTDLIRRERFVLGRLTRGSATWVEVLYAIERRRHDLIQTQISAWKRDGVDIGAQLEGVVRKQAASELVLVGALDGVHHVLLEYDADHWKRYRLVGGKRRRGEASDAAESPLETMHRELREELDTQFDRVFSVDHACSISLLDVSRRLGELTHYTFHVFQPVRLTGRSLNYDGTRRNYLRWFRLEDVLAAVERRDDSIFHQLLDETPVKLLLANPRCHYDLSPNDAARIMTARDDGSLPPA